MDACILQNGSVLKYEYIFWENIVDMEKIILFNPANGTLNSGDFIIEKYLKEEMAFLLSNSTVAEIGTHLPVAHFYQNVKKNATRKACDAAKYKFLCGTSLVKTSLLRFSPDWSLTPAACPYYRNAIAIGIGIDANSSCFDFYTRNIYQRIFSRDYIHSTRDDKTKRFLENMGFNAINTGCPSLWGLTLDFCSEIPHARKQNAIFTLTDYNKCPELDKKMIDILLAEYDTLFFWVQGFNDLEYMRSLTCSDRIKVIGHSLTAYEDVIVKCGGNVDYVGTRLHAGIFAIRHKIRSIIVSIDNRSIDIGETYNIPLIARDDIDDRLRSYINSEFETIITVPAEKINTWKGQFVNSYEK